MMAGPRVEATAANLLKDPHCFVGSPVVEAFHPLNMWKVSHMVQTEVLQVLHQAREDRMALKLEAPPAFCHVH
jgi:hypothetical protein